MPPWSGPPDRAMPGPHWGRPPERYRRPPAAFVLLAPVVISLFVQVPAAIGIAVWTRRRAGRRASCRSRWPWRARSRCSRRAGTPGPRSSWSRRSRSPTCSSRPMRGRPTSRSPSRSRSRSRAGPWPGLPRRRSSRGWPRSGSARCSGCRGIRSASPRPRSRSRRASASAGSCASARTRAAAYRAEAMRRRKAAEGRERVRIARELHDVIGHALSQINVQASVGLHLMDRDPEQAPHRPRSIKETSKTALDEVRSVLGVIRRRRRAARPAGRARRAASPAARRASRPGSRAELVDRLDVGARPRRAVRGLPHRAGGAHERRAARRRDPRRRRRSTTSATSSWSRSTTTGDRARAPRRRSPRARGMLGMRERADLLGGASTSAVAAGRCHGSSRTCRGGPPRDPRRARRRPAARAGRIPRLLEAEPDIEVVGEAVDRARSCSRSCVATPVDVVLMDIRMPGGDGLWATEQIAADPALGGVHVVIVTTFELDEYVARAIRAGASGFLVKDTEPVDLHPRRAGRRERRGAAVARASRSACSSAWPCGLRDAPDDAASRSAHRARARGAAPRRPGPHERRDRRAARALARSPRRRTSRASCRSCTRATACSSSSSPTSRGSSRPAGSE